MLRGKDREIARHEMWKTLQYLHPDPHDSTPLGHLCVFCFLIHSGYRVVGVLSVSTETPIGEVLDHLEKVV